MPVQTMRYSADALCVTLPMHRCAAPMRSLLCCTVLYCTLPCYALAILGITSPVRLATLHCYALHCYALALRFCTLPMPCVSLLCQRFSPLRHPCLCLAILCLTMPPHTLPCDTSALVRYTFPCHYNSMQTMPPLRTLCFALALLYLTMPMLCRSMPDLACAGLNPTMPSPCWTSLGCA